MYFAHVPGLSELECQENWEPCRKLLISKLQSDPSNVALLCRLISECWYVLCERLHGICIDNDPEYLNMKSTLIKATAYGLQHYMDDVNFLWQVGYMMAMFPNLFSDDEKKFIKIEQKGKEMVKTAYMQKPDDDVIRIIALGFEQGYKELSNEIKKVRKKTVSMFGTDTAVERYFHDFFSS